jgi:hypothetical protein
LEGLGVECLDMVYGHLVYFMVICYILRLSGMFYSILVYSPRFGMLRQDKSGNPGVSQP